MELDLLNPCWAGCRLTGETLTLDNGEIYTLHELRYFRWDRNNWKRIAEASDRELKNSKHRDAVVFELEELSRIRDALRLLDNRLPGYSNQDRIKDAILPRRRRR